MKKLTALILTLTMALALTACGSKTEEKKEDSSTEAAETYTVGICQLVQHVALDDASQGFMDALNAALPVDAATPVSIYCVPVLSRYSTCAS